MKVPFKATIVVRAETREDLGELCQEIMLGRHGYGLKGESAMQLGPAVETKDWTD